MDVFYCTTKAQRVAAHIAIDKADLPVKVTVAKGGIRSTQQNSYLWGVVYAVILQNGLKEQGWRADDLHEYFLGEFHGWETLSGFGKKRQKPVERSSGKTVIEFMEYVDFIIQKASEMGIYIPEPGEAQ